MHGEVRIKLHLNVNVFTDARGFFILYVRFWPLYIIHYISYILKLQNGNEIYIINPLVPCYVYAALCGEIFKLPHDIAYLSACCGHSYISL
jgi:hypothetical protein